MKQSVVMLGVVVALLLGWLSCSYTGSGNRGRPFEKSVARDVLRTHPRSRMTRSLRGLHYTPAEVQQWRLRASLRSLPQTAVMQDTGETPGDWERIFQGAEEGGRQSP